MDELAALDIAADDLLVRLAAVLPEHLDRPSACPGWSVFDLVNHVNGGGHRYLLLLGGAAADELTATRTQDHVRPDPVAACRRWQEPLAAAFAEPGALDRVVHHPAGDRSGRDLLRMRTLDLALHAWDLATSLGLDDALDPSLGEHLLAHGAGLVEELRGLGMYAQPGVDDGGPAQLRLLRLTGRA
ncbi:TIGR03086 family metal-binding protein [Candidatus Blastococcus massiliensis]|uniref:TIGR03086 family metal-binding protein n=1 Tax=Candidatus Blastococcus massiliensis TaxID=1470358 RepID=UPI0004AF36FD|nr:TIGR03086 family metal-binding protein [Candidatus Blastococcus massiliensis]